jgi:hypothetical protein
MRGIFFVFWPVVLRQTPFESNEASGTVLVLNILPYYLDSVSYT